MKYLANSLLVVIGLLTYPGALLSINNTAYTIVGGLVFGLGLAGILTTLTCKGYE